MYRSSAAILILLLTVVSISCKQANKGTGITSGRISYRITYLNDDLDKRTRNILPAHMELLFDEKQASNSIDGFMGMYKLHAFTNFNTRKCSTFLKVLDKNYLFKGTRDEQMCCFDTMEDMIIQETNETKTIAGFLCRKAIVRLPSNNETFAIFYTDEITLKHPNATNPYRKVKGVLMEFELTLIDLKMRFTAERFHELDRQITPKLNSGSKVVSRNQMTQILNKLME